MCHLRPIGQIDGKTLRQKGQKTLFGVSQSVFLARLIRVRAMQCDMALRHLLHLSQRDATGVAATRKIRWMAATSRPEHPFEHFLSVWQGPATDTERIDTPNMPIPHPLNAQKVTIAPLCPDLMWRESWSRMGLAGECPMGLAHLRCTADQRQVRAGTMRGTAPMAGGWLAEGSSTQ